MWCDNCDRLSYSNKTTIRITKDGREVIVQKCANCEATIESEHNKLGPTTSLKVSGSKKKHKSKNKKKRLARG